MSASAAQDLANAFYSLQELEFFRPYEKFPAEAEAVRVLVARAQKLAPSDFHSFSRELIQEVAKHCHNPSHSQGVLYRAFDGIDHVLQIDYQETHQMMPEADGSERLYEGGGTGVQTSYSTIMKVLEFLQLPNHSHLIDLGSGFGRVGLATGLWHDDLRFSGYEYVGHRVAAANASAARAGLGARVRFLQQDLSDPAFQIPAADAYYLYDPFSASTYQHVFKQITELAQERPTTVIAKAGAREGFRCWMDERQWLAPEALDEGTLLVYRSR